MGSDRAARFLSVLPCESQSEKRLGQAVLQGPWDPTTWASTSTAGAWSGRWGRTATWGSSPCALGDAVLPYPCVGRVRYKEDTRGFGGGGCSYGPPRALKLRASPLTSNSGKKPACGTARWLSLWRSPTILFVKAFLSALFLPFSTRKVWRIFFWQIGARKLLKEVTRQQLLTPPPRCCPAGSLPLCFVVGGVP